MHILQLYIKYIQVLIFIPDPGPANIDPQNPEPVAGEKCPSGHLLTETGYLWF